MCGIVGVLGRTPDRQEALASMMRAVRSRGEADETWFGDGFCVGTRRLKIVDRERAVQPIFNEDRSKLVIFNGEIFNFKRLKTELERNHTFTTESDTETILHAYEEYGPGCVHKFDGQFAFVVYDLVGQAVFAARDHIGIVPLYFAHDGHALYLASNIKALTSFGLPIKFVPPGHSLDADGRLTSYFEPVYDGTASSRDAYVAQLRRAIESAVAKRVDTDLPVGVIYSGGIDSSVVLHEACKRHADVTAFTIGTERSEDLEISKRYCGEHGVPQVVVSHEQGDIGLRNVKHAVRVTELNEYLDVINAVVTLPLFQGIHRAGVKVVLGGDGSDELFGGYHMYQQIPVEDEPRLRLHNLMSLHRTELQRVDRCSMAFEVEVRVPFLDLEVVDLALQMPSEWKMDGRMEKWPVREAYKDVLPAYVTERSKNPLSYSSGLHEAARMYKFAYSRYYNEFGYDLHEPMKSDFSYVLAKNGYSFDRALEEDGLGNDYPRVELLKEAVKAGARRFILGSH